MRLIRATGPQTAVTCSPAKRSASRGEATTIRHLGTSPAGSALRLPGLPARRQRWTWSPAKRSASRGEATPLRHLGTSPRRQRAAPVRITGPQTAVDL